jgi:threonyl-tRNA synthetase
MIKITLKDKSIKEFKKGTTGLEVAESISKSLAKSTIATLQDNEIVDLLTPIEKDVSLELITDENDKDALSVLRHSTAHVLAKAILDVYKDAKIVIGPSIDEGFYYDVDFGKVDFSDKDLLALEKQMTRVVASGAKFERKNATEKELLTLFKDNKYKQELIKDLKGQTLTKYSMGDFVDLCKGPHLVGVGKIKHFKLTHISGAYFKADSTKKQLTRIYGTAFFKKEMLDNHLKLLEERKDRDHRKIGKELDIFMIDQLGGRGFAF